MQKIDSTRHLTASYSLMQSLYWILDVALLAYVTLSWKKGVILLCRLGLLTLVNLQR